MATTTNYGWDTPDDTDLVKDGAAAIRTLGSSADTTVGNLNPGTTAGDVDYYTSGTAKARIAIGTVGQVLKVNAGGTAPEWGAAPDQTPLTTKGDLLTFDTADARLGVGANGTILTADSGETLGIKWATPAAGAPASATSSGTATTSTSSATYVDTSAAATLTTGTKALVLIGATVAFQNTSEESIFISFKVSGATTSAATDARGAQLFTSAANRPKVGLSRAILMTGLTAGSNTFTLQIRVSGGGAAGVDTGYNVVVIDMGS